MLFVSTAVQRLYTGQQEESGVLGRNFRLAKEMSKASSISTLEKVSLPPLHTKLGLMKQYFKALDQDGVLPVYVQ